MYVQVAVDGPNTMPPIDHAPWLRGQGNVPLAEWFCDLYAGCLGFEAHSGPVHLAINR